MKEREEATEEEEDVKKKLKEEVVAKRRRRWRRNHWFGVMAFCDHHGQGYCLFALNIFSFLVFMPYLECY